MYSKQASRQTHTHTHLEYHILAAKNILRDLLKNHKVDLQHGWMWGWKCAKVWENVLSFVIFFAYSVLAGNGSLRSEKDKMLFGQIRENEQFHNMARCLYWCLTSRRFWVQNLHGALGACFPQASRYSGGSSQLCGVWFSLLTTPSHACVCFSVSPFPVRVSQFVTWINLSFLMWRDWWDLVMVSVKCNFHRFTESMGLATRLSKSVSV